MSRVYIQSMSNKLNVSVPDPSNPSQLVADTHTTGEYQEFKLWRKDASGAMVEIDFDAVPVPPPPNPTPVPTPIPTPPSGLDALDLSQAVITDGSPDVRNWPITANFTTLKLGYHVEDEIIDFTKRWGDGAWSCVTGPEAQFPGDDQLQYTLWFGGRPPDGNGKWYFAACIPCTAVGPGLGTDHNYRPTGGTLNHGQLPRNWYYHARAPLKIGEQDSDTWQPAPGEMVAFMLTHGDQRRGNICPVDPATGQPVQERTQVIVVPFQ